ncbi:hypothetical protein HAX54_040803 [Datura stramonium]|uniref:Uncharacterized protein n=1 Tax=Datura stramonium TaxID=4076 RepID=A0ABS8VPF8_DATST|nr:hypothetical protein [Datura stramonium]
MPNLVCEHRSIPSCKTINWAFKHKMVRRRIAGSKWRSLIVHGDALGMMTVGYSPVRSSKMAMECRFELILASGHYFDPALHPRFADQDR